MVDESVELFARAMPRDQGRRPTCVAFAVSAAHEHLLGGIIVLSPEFSHWASKQVDGIPFGEGTNLAAATTALQQFGQAAETLWPYDASVDETLPSHGPSAAAIADAQGRRITATAPVGPSFASLRSEVNERAIVLLVIRTHQGWSLNAPGGVIGPPPDNPRFGYHAVLVVGYRTIGRRAEIVFRNSWGEAWGDQGYGYVTNQYLRHHGMDAYRIGHV